MQFKLTSPYTPQGDQAQAIKGLVTGLANGLSDQVLLGVTGSGKTFTMAKVIEAMQRPTLIISHNKTLAAQLYQEFKSFFPENAISYFVSYYDYYQPEAYIPQTDTYIDKETDINEEIDKLRLAATTNLLTRRDTLVVASVSCIYNIGSPKEYASWILELRIGMLVSRESIFTRLIELQYSRSDYGFHRGTFRVRGGHIDIFPAYDDKAIRIDHDGKKVTKIATLDPITGKKIESQKTIVLYPAKHYMTDPTKKKGVFTQIRKDLATQVANFKKRKKLIEAQRISERVTYDLEMIEQMGYVNGIENYSRYFDGRKHGEAAFTLLDYFSDRYRDDWLLFIDESHMTIPQIRGMYHGDRSRKETLIDYGFRLPAAIDNRPLKFEEFLDRVGQTIYVSATPEKWEINKVKSQKLKVKSNKKHDGIVEQLIRPTGLVDPEIEIRPIEGQIDDLICEIETQVKKGERVLVTTLTKQMAEDLSAFLKERKLRVQYLHSDIQTLERSDILTSLRQGKYDVIVGINLLREGLDLPEVSLVAILDADKAGFLRSTTSLVQTMGRAARHVSGRAILYADQITKSMEKAMDEVNRRRKAQIMFNKKHDITPKSIEKPIRERLVEKEPEPLFSFEKTKGKKEISYVDVTDGIIKSLTPMDRKKLVRSLKRQMRFFASQLNFEAAAEIRDKIKILQAVT